MNIRKNIDYSEMYVELNTAMADGMSQMELYCEIGKAVSQRSEKGAAVAAAEFLSSRYPDVPGFSPRNLRRMRDFYRAYAGDSRLMKAAMRIGWTQNIVILEAELTMDQRLWYMEAVRCFGWTKLELVQKIIENAYEEKALAIDEDMCYTETQEKSEIYCKRSNVQRITEVIKYLLRKSGFQWQQKEGGRRRWPITLCPIFMEKRSAFMRC